MGTARHETRALLRAHLSAAVGSGHLTHHCAVCHRLQRLAMHQGQEGPEMPPWRDTGLPRGVGELLLAERTVEAATGA